MSKEIIALLEKAKKSMHYQSVGFDYIDQALNLLKQQPAVGQPKEPHPCNYVNQKRAEQPTAGDLIETRIFESKYWVSAKDWNNLRDRLDKAEARSIDCPNRPASKTEIEMAKRLCDYQDEVHKLKQKPTAGEFTKKYREKLKKQYPMCHKNCSEWPLLDLLDTAEARLKVIPDLLIACELGLNAMRGLLAIADIPHWERRDSHIAHIKIIEAAIAKAKKEG